MHISNISLKNNYPKISFSSNNISEQKPYDDTEHCLLLSTLLTLASLSPIQANSGNYDNYSQDFVFETSAQKNKTNSLISKTAESMNLMATPNNNVYFDNKKNIYYMWDNKKQKFVKQKDFKNIYKTGYIKTQKGEYLTPDGQRFIYREGSFYLKSNLWNKTTDFALAIAKGYKSTNIADALNYNGIKNRPDLKLFYDSDKNKYYTWSDNRQDFVESDITDVSGMYYTKNDKRYKVEINNLKANVKEASNMEYQASKQKYQKTERDSVYTKNDCYYYLWNGTTETFTPFGDEYDKKQMLVQRADGKIGNFRQGDIGDCWLMSVIIGMNHHPNEVLRERFRKEFEKCYSIDENENITVKLRGPQKEYKYSKEDIDSVLQMPYYHYSIGDRDVVAVEMAIEQYKRDIKEHSYNPHIMNNIYNMHRRPFKYDDDYVLDGGQSFDAIHLLTNKEAHHICNSFIKDFIVHDNTIIPGNIDENLLKKYMDDNIVLVSYKTTPNDNEGHVVLLTGIDEENVYVIDSNIDDIEPNKTIHPVARNKKDFMNQISAVTYTDLSVPITNAKSKPVKVKYILSPEAKKILPSNYSL